MTTLLLVRHGVTAHTSARRFSGGLGGDDPGLSDEGRAQAEATATWLSRTPEGSATLELAGVVASPVRRTRETAEILAARLDRPVEVEPGFAETEFGEWDGLTLEEVGERYGSAFADWRDQPDFAPPGGESLTTVRTRVLAGLERVLVTHPTGVVVVVSHVTPIKLLVAHALGVPIATVFRMELSPASVSVVTFGERRAGLRLYNARPPGVDPFRPPTTTW